MIPPNLAAVAAVRNPAAPPFIAVTLFISLLAPALVAGSGCGGGKGRQRPCVAIEGCSSDAGDIDLADAAIDGGGADGQAPPEETVFDPSIVNGDLPADVAGNATTPVMDGEAAVSGAATYEVVTGMVSADDEIPAIEQRPGREATLMLRWGYLPGMSVPTTTSTWHDFSGYIAVGDGTVELLRALRWQGPSDPSAPRPTDFVAPQTDPRVLRFRSSIGSGSDALLVRLRRPAVRPTVVAIAVAGDQRLYPLEIFLATRISSGGWQVPAGNVLLDSALPELTASCYKQLGTLAGTFAYSPTEPRTALTSLAGTLTDEAGASLALVFQAIPELRGPYGAFTGSLGTDGTVVRGYYGRNWQFAAYDNAGIISARLEDSSGAVVGFITGGYGAGRFMGNRNAFRPADCDEPSATSQNLFRY
jgi:hypothetical protein